jgi:AraC-like DNA-binding protein
MNMQHTPLLERSGVEKSYQLTSLSWAQLEPGAFDVSYAIVDAPPVRVSLRHYNLGFKAEAGVLPLRGVVALLARCESRARWFGSAFNSDSIATSRNLIDVRTEGPSAFFQVTVDDKLLALQYPGAPDARDLIEKLDGASLMQDPVCAARLRACIYRTLFTSRLPTRVASGTLVPMLAAAVDGVERRTLQSSKSFNRRLSAVRSCEAFMREHIDATVTLLDLSQASGMRSRSLINAFEAVTGFSPMDYLKRLRLNGVRRALQCADKTRTRIIDVATAWGFWHMGHFASDYRAMFGEAPSQTLLK